MEADTAKPTYDGDKLQKEGGQWLEKIRAAETRERDWRRDAEAAETAYSGDAKAKHGKTYAFNILHSNVETIVPAIYNSTPIPDVRRRWTEALEEPKPPQPPQQGQQPDPRQIMAFQQAAQQYQQKVQADKAAKDYGDMIERAITVQIDDNRLDTEIERSAQDAFLSGRGIVRIKLEADVNGEQVANEHIAFEAVSWRDYRQGPATRWENVEWVSFRHCLPRETLDGYTDKEMLASQTTPSDKLDDSEDDIAIWEVWCKSKRQIYFVREHDCKILNVKDDPLGLKGFFPIPHPVQPIALTGRLTPVCPFSIYQKLADELDTITKRIDKIMKGLKVRGIVAGDAQKIVELADADDNEIRVETDLEGLAQTGGLEKAVMWWPVEQSIKVLSELYKQREIVKQAIYEITGISDIVRGASMASETATAQQIKTQWGSLRIQKMQRLIARQVRDIFCMMSELITSKFSEQTLYNMTAVEMTDGIRQLMQQPVLASYRVDVESDSTVRADLTRQKQDMTEFLTGTANFFSTMGPLLQESPEAAGPVADIYASMASVFKLGRNADEALEKLKNIAQQAASQPRPNPQAEQAQAEMQMKQQELQMKIAEGQAKVQVEGQKAQMDHQRELVRLQADAQKAQNENSKMQFEKWKAELDSLTKIEVAKISAQQKNDSDALDAQLEAALHLSSQEHEMTMTAMQGDGDGSDPESAQEDQGEESQTPETIVASTRKPAFPEQLNTTLQGLAEAMKAVAAPKRVVRGPDGRISHVEPMISPTTETIQ